jgi:hypothetical protein
MGEFCALWRLMLRPWVSGRVPDRHATDILLVLTKDLKDQTGV